MDEVDECEILEGQKDLPREQRLTRFNCKGCQNPLSVQDLSSIRINFAPCMHYECFIKKK